MGDTNAMAWELCSYACSCCHVASIITLHLAVLFTGSFRLQPELYPEVHTSLKDGGSQRLKAVDKH